MNLFSRISARNKTLIIWGLFDALAVTWYCLREIADGDIPYFSDFILGQRFLIFSGPAALYWAAKTWGFHLLLLISSILLLSTHRYGKYLAYAQMPLRLIVLLPSVSLITIFHTLHPVPTSLLAALVLASEAIKARTLWKYA